MLQFDTNADLFSLYDKDFLIALTKQKDREIFAKITSLNFDEEPVEQIEGKVTGGSINIDGDSSVQRTCSITMISDDDNNIHDYYWAIKTKFVLEIGLRNNLIGEYSVENKYPKIVWFPQGHYIVSTFNTSASTSGCTISLQGKDKMSLLNGDLGGQLFASIDFGAEEETNIFMDSDTIDANNLISSIGLNKYYIDISTLPSEKQPITIVGNEIIGTDSLLYSFTPVSNSEVKSIKQKNPSIVFYYKTGNIYNKLLTSDIQDYYKFYRGYKLIESPDDLFSFTSLTKEQYKQNTYYYKTTEGKKSANNEFQLDSSKNFKQDRAYYTLNNVYTKRLEIEKKKLTLEKIIRESVHTYGKEPYHNIIINDLDRYGLEQLTYKGDKNLYALYDVNSSIFTNVILEGQNPTLDNVINEKTDFIYRPANDTISDIGTRLYYNQTEKKFSTEQQSDSVTNIYTVAKFSYGMDLGYRLTELVYTGDLISNAGETLTSMLDKIKTMLGDFEYFYDIKGRFIFQRKKTYIQTSWNQLINNKDETYVNFTNDSNKLSFNFENNLLISAISNNPNLNQVRNDYIVWGSRKGISGTNIPIHSRYAIDKKPVFYRSLSGNIYTTDIKYPIEQGILTQEEYDNIKNTKYDLIINRIKQLLQKFALKKPFPYKDNDNNSFIPTFNEEDYSWTPGWWSFADWVSYYQILHQSYPSGPLKLYTTNDEQGCVSIKELLALKDINDQDCFTEYQKKYYNTHDRSIWLIEVSNNGKMKFTHNGRNNTVYDRTLPKICSYYDTDATGETTIKKQRILFPPFANCSDEHDINYFFDKEDAGDKQFYIYNPNFSKDPKMTPQKIIEQQIQNSPNMLNAFKNLFTKYKIHIVDWREIIYQMALDYFAGQGCSEKNPLYIFNYIDNSTDHGEYKKLSNPDHFLYEVGKRNSYYYPTGKTGYEQYYTDMQGFWRELYNPDYIPTPIYSNGTYKTTRTNKGLIKEWIPPKIVNYNIKYYIDKTDARVQDQLAVVETLTDEAKKEYNNKLTALNYENAFGRLYWNTSVFEQPETLNFWIDFLDSDFELAQFSVSQIGDRTKVVKEDKLGSIVYSTIPNFILYNEIDYTKKDIDIRQALLDNSGYVTIKIPRGYSQYFTISYRGDSIKDKIDSLLYQYSYCAESINITAIPVYFLTPNTRIFVQDNNTKINGEYLVNKITIPLSYNGTSSITAVKAPVRLY